MREELVANIISFIKSYFNDNYHNGKIQMFDSRNTAGDILHPIWRDTAADVVIEYCSDYDYIEIFGLTSEEFDFIDGKVGDNEWKNLIIFQKS